MNKEKGTSKKFNKYVGTIEKNGYRLLRMVNNIIDLTKIDSESFDLNLKNCNIFSLINNIYYSLKYYFANKNRKLNFNYNCQKVIIACDPVNIERIILNLLSNSIKYTKGGDTITINIKKMKEYIEISVKDTGVGIKKEKRKVIFDNFRQADESFSRPTEGSGMGLKIVKSLVELHNGNISLKSTYGEGSAFIIKLPNKQLPEEKTKNIDLSRNLIDRYNMEFSDIFGGNIKNISSSHI